MKTNRKGPKTVWIPKNKIIHLLDILNKRKDIPIMVPGQWLLMSHDRRKIFPNLKLKKGGKVIFWRDQHNQMIGSGHVSLKPFLCISNFLLVDGLNHNLFSISQLCDSGNNVIFYKDQCTIYQTYGTKMFASSRHKIIYKNDMEELSSQKCWTKWCSSFEESKTLWRMLKGCAFCCWVVLDRIWGSLSFVLHPWSNPKHRHSQSF